MRCPACNRESQEGAVFCDECGARLACACRACGASLRTAARFCKACGRPVGEPTPTQAPHTYPSAQLANKILSSRAALEGERKQVTVLFADVKGSMELAEGMDPEQWAQIMQRFFRTLSEGVERFEGFIDKFTGDGIMALFGAPIAHEDHARRACYAALHLTDELRRHADELRLRRGLTGDDATRARELREARRLFVEVGATGHAERIAGEMEAGGRGLESEGARART